MSPVDGGGMPRRARGIGVGWRPEIDLTVERLPGIDFVEVLAENIDPDVVPESLRVLRGRGIPVIAHAVSLSLGGAEPLDRTRIARLAAVAEAVDAPLVSEHVAFTRAGGLDSGHLLPVPRTREALDVLVANVKVAQAELPVPLALENIAALFDWPDNDLTEGQFLTELVERTDCLLLIDVANLHANTVNLGTVRDAFLDEVPLERLAYVHVAGGTTHDGLYHDTHRHAVPQEVLDTLALLCARTDPPGVMLERDDDYPSDTELATELAAIRAVVAAAEQT
ncbi:DUF692 domain-containing protein [Saccharomonospora azurea]|uniref:DUF692 domain-containing protein n=1 Tax=Saccharomonospora azurea TaxID=40988 RepID=UPI0002400A47|nr:DUF692 domain-containing protein [Saccharomonospora azurea]EHK85284.1 hypothetical protein SZMC14600_16666 [Saccharomonospora azurea SZMC 14600]